MDYRVSRIDRFFRSAAPRIFGGETMKKNLKKLLAGLGVAGLLGTGGAVLPGANSMASG
jgi:hypothetical protein